MCGFEKNLYDNINHLWFMSPSINGENEDEANKKG